MNGVVCELTKCLRTESKGIIELSHAIHRGDDSLLKSSVDGVRRLEFPCENEWKAQKHIIEWACKHYPSSPVETITPENFATYIQSYCLLSPLRRGPLGVDQLNEQIMMKLSDRLIIPIMIVKNNPEFHLYNGDVGLLVNNDTALFLDEEGNLRQKSKLLLPDYEYAFCMSVHKSQGSEFDHVTLLMPEGSEIFGREVFYTGVTRARKQLDVWGTDKTLKAAIKKKTIRNSGL